MRIREVANPGTKEEKEKSPEEENGFLWQMETWWRMEERDGGVYVQNEAVTLTQRYSGWAGLADWAVCDQHPERDVGIHDERDARSRFRPREALGRGSLLFANGDQQDAARSKQRMKPAGDSRLIKRK